MANEALAINAQGDDAAFVNPVRQCPSQKGSFCFCASWRALSIHTFLPSDCRNLTLRSSSRPLASSRGFEKIPNRRKAGTQRMRVENVSERHS